MNKVWAIATSMGAILAFSGCAQSNIEQNVSAQATNKQNKEITIDVKNKEISNSDKINTLPDLINGAEFTAQDNEKPEAVKSRGDYSKYDGKIITLQTVYVYGTKNS